MTRSLLEEATSALDYSAHNPRISVPRMPWARIGLADPSETWKHRDSKGPRTVCTPNDRPSGSAIPAFKRADRQEVLPRL